MKISMVLDKVDEKQLFVPAFQREYVWKREQAKRLMDSLIKEYPTGSMLIWETASPPQLKGPHKYDQKQGAIKLLLDGQQRVTTLYMLIRGEIPPYYTKPEIINETRNLYVNLETLELSYYMKAKMQSNPLWRNITDVLQGKVDAFSIESELSASGRQLSREELRTMNANVGKILSIKERDFPEQQVPIRASVRDAIDIFYTVNSSGVSLTDAELALAQICGYWPQARDAFKKKLAELGGSGFVFKLDFIVYVLLACLYHLGSDMRKLHGEENDQTVRSAWEQLRDRVLDYVLNILRTHAYVDHTDEITSPYVLIPIVAYVYDKRGEPLNEDEIRRMIKWFYYAQIRSRYVVSQPQRLDSDLRVVAESAQPFDELLSAIAQDSRLDIQPDEFVGSGVGHPLFSLMRWYMKSRNAVCLSTGVGLRKNMGEKYQLEDDHIFPFSRLKSAGYGKANRLKYALAQEMTNRAVLTFTGNRTKHTDSADQYLAAVKQRHPDALKLQCIPEDESLWQMDQYENFLHERRRMLADDLNGFLHGITETTAVTSPVRPEELLSEGESEVVEFKSSLRWDYKRGTVSRIPRDEVVEAVAAFANADGGTLLIGVNDAGEVIGLENDYASLGDGADKDKFQRHLLDLLKGQFGAAFVTAKVAVTFPAVENREICQIDVAQASEPMVVKVRNAAGQEVEKFFVRVGNTSQDMPLSEMSAYMKERFRQ